VNVPKPMPPPERAELPEPGPAPIEKLVVRWCCPFCPRESAEKSPMAKHIPKCWHNPAVKACFSCAHRVRPAQKGAPAGCKAGCTMPAGTDPVTHCPKWEPYPRRADQ
jgi:hypothetical protein